MCERLHTDRPRAPAERLEYGLQQRPNMGTQKQQRAQWWGKAAILPLLAAAPATALADPPPFEVGGTLGESKIPNPPVDDVGQAKLPFVWNTYLEPTDNPFGHTAPNNPSGAELHCTDGQGYSFESGHYEGWEPAPANGPFGRLPVFGNNVHITRMGPSGFFSPEAEIGGDYWQFSRDVNQRGNWWVGSSDHREDWRILPGQRFPETSEGTLTSPVFIIATPFIHFQIGGATHTGQRVQLQVRNESSTGVPLPPPQYLLDAYDGIGQSEFPPGPGFFLDLDPGWVTVRASSALDDKEFMERRAVWNVDEFMGLEARLVVVDSFVEPSRNNEAPMAHINADDFRCASAAPEGTEWYPSLSHVEPVIGTVLTPIPVWGITDSHTHPLANLAFGGHYLWGDPSDPLDVIYDCHQPLEAILDLQDNVVRPASYYPSGSKTCKLSGDLIASAVLATPLLCQLNPECVALVEAFIAILSQIDIFETHWLHGAHRAGSGGFKGVGIAADVFPASKGLIGEVAWDASNGEHTGQGLGRLHQQYHADMIKRAWRGGLRLVGADVINSRIFQKILDGQDNYHDWKAIGDMVEGIKRLIACENDPTYHVGPLCDVAEIAYTPGQARQIIGRNKIAIVLGTEVDELGKYEPSPLPQIPIAYQVDLLYALGIRKVTPIHGMNNPLGGAGFFVDIYNTGNQYNARMYDEHNTQDGTMFAKSEFIEVPGDVPIAGGMPLIELPMFEHLEIGPCQADPDDPQVCNWNTDLDGWFRSSHETDYSINFRFGFSSAASPLAPYLYEEDAADADKYFAVSVLGTQPGMSNGTVSQIHTFGGALAWIFSGGGECALDGTPMPVGPHDLWWGPFPAEVGDNYDCIPVANGCSRPFSHRNEIGLRQPGRDFVNRMMLHGMVLDLDHFSQNAREDAYELAQTFGAQTGLGPYPTFGVHTSIRGINSQGPAPDVPWIRYDRGFSTEVDRTPEEFDLMKISGGAMSPGVNASLVRDSPELSPLVRNDCDFSSKSFALKYLWMVDRLDGRHITPSSDMNGTQLSAPRYGTGACHLRPTPPAKAAVVDASNDHTPKDSAIDRWWPHDWSELNDTCAVKGIEHPGCTTYQIVQDQYREASGVVYDSYLDPAALKFQPDDSNAPEVWYVRARAWYENRDDEAKQLFAENQWVSYGGSRQMAPIKKWAPRGEAVPGNTGWDINIDGFMHVGLYPDFLQDVRNIGVTWEYMTPLFNSAEEYIRMWERQCAQANIARAAQNLTPIDCD